jgi:hypothetical protein
MKKFTTRLFGLATLTLGIAAAADPYTVQLTDTFSVGKAELKAGDYKVEMQGDKAVFTSGKKIVAIPATLAKTEQTFDSTVVISQRTQLREIDLGGTQEKIVFASAK